MLSAAVAARITAGSEHVGRLRSKLDLGLPDTDTMRLRIDDLLKSAATHLDHGLRVSSGRTDGLRQRLTALSPALTLRRGYAIVRRERDGAVVNEASGVAVGESVGVTLSRGSFDADVTSVTRKETTT